MSLDKERNLKNWLVLHHAQGVGNQAALQLFRRLGNLSGLSEIKKIDLKALGFNVRQCNAFMQLDHAAIEKDFVWQQAQDQHIICWEDERYPSLLREIPDPPIVLFVRGDVSLLSHPQIAIVGSRHPTSTGRETAFQFAKHLARYFVVTSGFALGIDAAAHQGALAAKGKTIAVMGTGLNKIYPIKHYNLAHQVVKTGALVSEFSPDVGPHPGHFPRRNRIISGLSVGTLVVEAALKSGSLITARQALEQGREVFSIPGSIHNALARGCHHLIRQGAKLVEETNDILEELSALISYQADSVVPELESQSSVLDSESEHLLSLVGFEPTPVDVLVARSGWRVESLSSVLLRLELDGHVRLESGGYQRLA